MKVLKHLPSEPNTKIAMLLRHAERDGQKDALTETGKKAAFEFGENLKAYKVNAVYSSPTERCITTANKIIDGYGQDVPLVLDDILAETTLYVSDIDKAIETYHKLGPEEYFRRLAAGEPLEGYKPYKEGSQRLQKFIEQTTYEHGLTLYITHNFIIRLFNHYINNYDHNVKFMKVDYLKGLILEL